MIQKDTITPDELEDVCEVIEKLDCIFDEYHFRPSQRVGVVFTALARVGKSQIEKGVKSSLICDSFRAAFHDLTEHLLDFEETEGKR